MAVESEQPEKEIKGQLPIKRVWGGWRDLEESDWRKLASILKRKHPLPAGLRDAIETPTRAFAHFGPMYAKANTVPFNVAVPAIENWRKAATRLRRELKGIAPAAGKKLSQKAFIDDCLKDVTRKKLQRMVPVEFLLFWLQKAIDASAVASAKIELRGAPHFTDLWSVWIVRVARSLQEASIKTSAPSVDIRTKPSPFVTLIGYLQERLPAECRRRSGDDSLAQGIKGAKRSAGRLSDATLMLIAVGMPNGFAPAIAGRLEKLDGTELEEFYDLGELALSEMRAFLARRKGGNETD